MAVIVSVFYPDQEGARFDFDDYLGRHMPMVSARFARFGLTGWRVVKGVGERPPFRVVAHLDFGTADQFRAAADAEGEAVFGDVLTFTDLKPVVVVGDVVGSG